MGQREGSTLKIGGSAVQAQVLELKTSTCKPAAHNLTQATAQETVQARLGVAACVGRTVIKQLSRSADEAVGESSSQTTTHSLTSPSSMLSLRMIEDARISSDYSRLGL